jgi:hypothetical protein
MQPQTQKISGRVTRTRISPGSKSDHQGVVLRTISGEEFILRRAGGNAFRDETLDGLVGTTIIAKGIVVGQTFIMQDWTVTKGK